jgi:hypothetical protein
MYVNLVSVVWEFRWPFSFVLQDRIILHYFRFVEDYKRLRSRFNEFINWPIFENRVSEDTLITYIACALRTFLPASDQWMRKRQHSWNRKSQRWTSVGLAASDQLMRKPQHSRRINLGSRRDITREPIPQFAKPKPNRRYQTSKL